MDWMRIVLAIGAGFFGGLALLYLIYCVRKG